MLSEGAKPRAQRFESSPEPRARRIAAVVPAYRAKRQIEGVIRTMPEIVDHIIVVDDACPDGSGAAAESVGDPRVVVVRHEKNRGVGGSVKTGMQRALALGADLIFKIDGDGQMNPQYIPRLLAPLVNEQAAYTKGNRFWHLAELNQMPVLRRIGNLGLSFMVKAASGHWGVFDPTNGFVAIRADALRSLDLGSVANDYFFEISMLIELGKRGFRVVDIPMPSRYGDEQSSLSIWRTLVGFPPRLLRRGISRFLFRHFWFSFTITACFVLAALPLLAFGIGFGALAWWRSLETGEPATAGTVMLAALPFLTGFQLLLQALNQEVSGQFNSRISPDSPLGG